MLDENDSIIKVFSCLADACRYLNKPMCGTTRIKNVCDKYCKNGKRQRFFGYYWTFVCEGVSTNCKAEDELLSE